MLTRASWTGADELHVGDEVLVVASPDRRPDRKLALGQRIHRADGSILFASPQGKARYEGTDNPVDRNRMSPETADTIFGTWFAGGFTDGLDQGFGGAGPSGAGMAGGPATGMGGFPGGGMAVPPGGGMTTLLGGGMGGLRGARAPTYISLTEQGEASLARNAPNPLSNCGNNSMPLVLDAIYPMAIWEGQDDTLIIGYELSSVDRVVHMNTPEHPAEGEFVLGHSVGWWEEGELVVETANFAPHDWGLARGIASGTQKHIVERYRLGDDRKTLELTYTVSDPEYIAEPFTRSFYYRYPESYELQPYDCDAASANQNETAGQ